MHTFTMTEAQARMIHEMADQQIKSLKNWMVSAVERGDLNEAQNLARDVRAHQAIFAAFNMDAKFTVANATGRAVVTDHTVRAV